MATIRIVDQTPFTDRTDPANPKDKVMVSYVIVETGTPGSLAVDKGTPQAEIDRKVQEDAKKKVPQAMRELKI